MIKASDLSKTNFSVGNWKIHSQNPAALRVPRKQAATWLAYLLVTAQHIERVTGHRWKATSYIRESPSHKFGYALDIAPDISARSSSLYPVHYGSDPVLYKRLPLMEALQVVARSLPPTWPVSMGMFVEPDHIHLHVLNRLHTVPPHRVVQWKQPKEIYCDTLSRMQLPPTRSGYGRTSFSGVVNR